ncbi:MAG: serine/threonine protein kinase [Solirubrobacteraceae bacterium]|nr:serine/threonine protein kinase [Solirubrobacteraceae bacterium]
MGDNPFLDEDVRNAFSELDVAFPFLGAGTFKVAYRVDQPDGDRVLKIVKAPLEEGNAALPVRLDREINAMKDVDSERIVPVLDGPSVRPIASQRHVYYLEPFYADGTLDEYLDGPCELAFLRALAEDLLEAVETLWSKGIVHRDIKPENIARSEGRSVLLDLGIAYFADLTPVTEPLGASPKTPAFAAPEQFEIRRMAEIDHRTDLFQVGVVLFIAATGSHPYRPDDPSAYLNRLANGEIDEQAFEAAGTPDGVRKLLRRLLQPEPNRRFRTPALALQAAREAFE